MNKNPFSHNVDQKEDTEENEQEEEVTAKTTVIPPIDPLLAHKKILFFEGLCSHGVVPYCKPNRAPANPLF